MKTKEQLEKEILEEIGAKLLEDRLNNQGKWNTEMVKKAVKETIKLTHKKDLEMFEEVINELLVKLKKVQPKEVEGIIGAGLVAQYGILKELKQKLK